MLSPDFTQEDPAMRTAMQASPPLGVAPWIFKRFPGVDGLVNKKRFSPLCGAKAPLAQWSERWSYEP